MPSKIQFEKTLYTLNTVEEVGYIKSESLPSYVKKLEETFSSFFLNSRSKNETIPAPVALECMKKLLSITEKNHPFRTFFQDTIFDLHDFAIKGDDLTRTIADNQLLRFFSREAPSTIERKKRLLDKINNMDQLDKKSAMLSDVIYLLTDHYDQNQQFNEDPDLSILRTLSDTLNIIYEKKNKKKISAQEKIALFSCVTFIKERAPHLYETHWVDKFKPLPERQCSCPDIKEAVVVARRNPFSSQKTLESRIWDRN